MDDPIPQMPRGDQPYTVRITIISLLIGMPVAVFLGAALYSLN